MSLEPHPHNPAASARNSPTRWSWLALALALAACVAPVPDREALPLQDVPALSAGPAQSAAPAERWWIAFGDPGLTAEIDAALAGNFSLAAAWERLRAADALVQRTAAARSPQVDGVASAEVRDGEPGGHSREFGLGLEAAFEVDLWGRVRAMTEAEELRAAATEADYHTAAITLSAECALAWYQLAEAKQQRALIGQQLATNNQVREVLELRFAVGQSDSADVLRQRQLVEATREQAIVADARVETLEHQLAVLTGRAPQAAATYATGALPALGPAPAAGLPSQLLERRPDVRAAFLRLAAADADVAAAAKERYPRFDLRAAITTTAEDPTDLFDDWVAALIGQVIAPLVDGGARQAEVDRALALRRQRVAEYGQAVLFAFQEVEDALALEARQVERIASLRAQLSFADRTAERLRSQYLSGAADFIAVLSAQREQQALARDLLSAQLDRVAYRIALHRALAGGFAHASPDLETPPAAPPTDSDDKHNG